MSAESSLSEDYGSPNPGKNRKSKMRKNSKIDIGAVAIIIPIVAAAIGLIFWGAGLTSDVKSLTKEVNSLTEQTKTLNGKIESQKEMLNTLKENVDLIIVLDSSIFKKLHYPI